MTKRTHPLLEAIVFDLDGVLIATEELWDHVRERLTRERGGRWSPAAHHAMMGMNTGEWTTYMHAELGLDLTPDEIRHAVVERLAARYRADLPLLPGAVTAVRALAERWPLGLASSSPQALIDLVLELADVGDCFSVALSSEAVENGKPAPDVYLAVLERLGVRPAAAAAIEDSASGLRAAHAAGMRVVAIPNPTYPPPNDALTLADLVLTDAKALTVDALTTHPFVTNVTR